MRLVINKCYGGFSLSDEATELYADIKGIKIHRVSERYYSHYETEDGTYFSNRDIERDDPALVAVVEQLGEKANGECAELEIVYVPDGICYEIDDYDGMETVEECHRSWG